MFQYDQYIWSLDASPDGRLVAAGTYHGDNRVHDAAAVDIFAKLPEHSGQAQWMQWSHDGEYLAVSSERTPVWVWEVSTGVNTGLH